MKVFLYIRVACADQLAAASQREELEHYAKDKGYEVAAAVAADGISGVHTEGIMNFLLNEAKRQGIGTILTRDTSRISRDTSSFMRFERKFRENGIRFEYLSKPCLLYTSNLPQQHLRKALIDLSQCVIKGRRLFRSNCRRDRRDELFDCIFIADGGLAGHGFFHLEGTHSAQTLITTIGMLVHIAVIYVCSNVGKQLAADLIGFAVKNDDVHRHFIFEKETANGVNRHFESLILRIAENAGGNQRERSRFAAVFLRQHERCPITGDQQFALTMPSVIPARTDSMNDIFAGQLVALRDFCAPDVYKRQQRTEPHGLAAQLALCTAL